ncbi:Hypothetical protein SCV20265_1369 [Pseudomonas aeruginosa SCV20265]|nr:Hypothetical protein SCV20265_1369 [Pseudomonas aeruginosa SCV20265]
MEVVDSLLGSAPAIEHLCTRLVHQREQPHQWVAGNRKAIEELAI